MQVFVTGTVALLLVASSIGMAQTRLLRASRPETFDSAAIDANGDLAIVRSNGPTVVVRKEGEQTSFSPPVLSSGHSAVAAQAMFANCCTSYDIPLQLVVYS